MMHGFGWEWFGWWGVLMMILFWGLLILLAAGLIKYLFQGSRSASDPPRGQALKAREILDQRYARGEIDREQYELMKNDLQ
jgi:putative membrane protein